MTGAAADGVPGQLRSTSTAIALAACLLPVARAEEPGRAAPPGLFEAESILAIALEAPWKAALRDREDRPTVEGTLTLRGADGAPVRLDVAIKLRGKWRLENCSTPPLTLKLRPEQLEGTVFAGQATVHASVPCRSGKRHMQNLLKEHLAYRIYAALTDLSLRTRRVEIEFRGDAPGRSSEIRHGFVVEDIGLAAARLGRLWIEAETVAPEALAPDSAALFALFQFLIGHTDWSFLESPPGERCCHNAAVLAEVESAAGLVPVPFDFDASGLVDSGDIPPPEILPIRSVRERYYRGLCLHNGELDGAIERLRRARSAIEALVDDEPLLSAKARRSTRRYLDQFYETIEDPERRREEIVARCRG